MPVSFRRSSRPLACAVALIAGAGLAVSIPATAAQRLSPSLQSQPTPTKNVAKAIARTAAGGGDGTGDESSIFAELDQWTRARLLSGDKPLTLPQAAQFRLAASGAAASLAAATPQVVGAPAWQPAGPGPTAQVGRTTNTYEPVSGRVAAVAIRPTAPYTMYAGGAQGGVWSWNWQTKKWSSLTDSLPTLATGSIAISSSNPDVMYLGTGEGNLSGDSYYGDGVWRSTDAGKTWSHVGGSSFVGVSIPSIAIDPTNPNHLYAATTSGVASGPSSAPTNTNYGVFESRNGGRTWTESRAASASSYGASDVLIDPIDPRIVYASFFGDGILKSTDSGQHWRSVMTGLPAPGAPFVKVAIALGHVATKSPVLYAGYDWYDSTGTEQPARVFTSHDGGNSWTMLPAGSGTDSVADYCATQCFYDNVLAVDPRDPNVVFVLGIYGYGNSPQSGGIYRSTDGGQTWKNLGYDLHPDYHAFAILPGTHKVLIGNDGGVWSSSNYGGRMGTNDPLSATDWRNLNGSFGPGPRNYGLQITQFTSIALTPYEAGGLWGGSQDNGTQWTANNSKLWIDAGEGDGGQVLVDPTGAYVYGTHYGVSPYRFSSVHPGAGAFDPITNGINTNDPSSFYLPWAMNQGNPGQLVLGTYRMYRTDNANTAVAGDVTWKPISGDLSGCLTCTITAVGLSAGGTGVYSGGSSGAVYVSPTATTSSTPSWTPVGLGTLPNRPVMAFSVDQSNWRIAYVAFAGFDAATPTRPGHIFKTIDGGRSWTDVSGNLPDIPVSSVLLDPGYTGRLYVGTDVGVFESRDDGHSWHPAAAGMPRVAVVQVDLDPSRRVLAVGTHGRGAFTLNQAISRPALRIATTDTSIPVGPGSTVDYTVTVSNVGNAAATRTVASFPLPRHTTFVSASNGGNGAGASVVWSNLTIAAGASITLKVSVRVDRFLPPTATSIVADGITVVSSQGALASSSQHVIALAAAHQPAVTPSGIDGARVGSSVELPVTVTNLGYLSDVFTVSTSGAWSSQVLDSTCTSPIITTPTLAPGTSTAVCVKIDIPASAADDQRSPTTLTVASVSSPSAHATSTLTAIAVRSNILLVDQDGGAPDVQQYYTQALADSSRAYGYWDLAASSTLPANYLKAHSSVIWFTGTSYPNPMGAYENELSTYLSGGGRLFLSGQDVLDQSAGTSAFVRNYLHVSWDGSETQNDIPTAAVHGVSGSPIGGSFGSLPLDLGLYGGAQYSDEVTPIGPATPAFTDDRGNPDGLSVSTGGYKVVFLAFPFEEIASRAARGAMMGNVLSYFS